MGSAYVRAEPQELRQWDARREASFQPGVGRVTADWDVTVGGSLNPSRPSPVATGSLQDKRDTGQPTPFHTGLVRGSYEPQVIRGQEASHQRALPEGAATGTL